MLNALTVDVEDFFQVSAYEKIVRFEDWDNYGDRVVNSTGKILGLLKNKGIRATFFIVGWTAERFPELVQQIFSAGHEIGVHSYRHRLIYNLTPNEFREDIVKCRDILESITGKRPVCFRAPSFSITQKSLWALNILADEGFEYDSSIYPIYHDRYGIPNSNPEIHELQQPAGTIWEFPPAVYRILGYNFPVSGGGYFRLYPYWLSRSFLQKINQRLKRPFVIYVHPWEFDPEQPVIPGLSAVSKFRHHVGIRKNLSKLDRLTSDFQFGALSEAISQWRCFKPASERK